MIAAARAKPLGGAQECRAGRRCDLVASYIDQVQHRQVENDAHEFWICEVPVCTRYSLDDQDILWSYRCLE